MQLPQFDYCRLRVPPAVVKFAVRTWTYGSARWGYFTSHSGTECMTFLPGFNEFFFPCAPPSHLLMRGKRGRCAGVQTPLSNGGSLYWTLLKLTHQHLRMIASNSKRCWRPRGMACGQSPHHNKVTSNEEMISDSEPTASNYFINFPYNTERNISKIFEF